MVINKVKWAKTFLASSINSNKTKIPYYILPIMLAIFMGLSLMSPAVYADDYPPCWDGSGTPNPVHWSPVPWPDETGGWIPYTHQQIPIKDKRIQDPSNGGRAPENYANVSSSCSDQNQPSVAWSYIIDSSPTFMHETFYFRWKVEQIANSYATGPSAGAYQNNDPWKEAQWTVLMDITGDGFYDFAVHIDGQSGIPAEPIDVLKSIYNTTKSQSIEPNGVNIFEIAHNPTAFVDCLGGGEIMNFRNSFSPTPVWPNGSGETIWDYGTTRAMDITTYDPKCIEYNVDYQIPLDMLDASDFGGPTLDAYTPFCMVFVTANSNIDPLQKDVVFDGDFTFSVDDCIPCGDLITLNGGASIPQPTVDWVTAVGCGPTDLTAQVRDAINPGCDSTVASVDFYYYYDANNNGLPDDPGSTWTFAGAATVDPDNPSLWTLTDWDSTIYLKGQYLIGVRAEDEDPDDTGPLTSSVTWSYLTQAEVDEEHPGDYANPYPKPGVVYDTYINYCGLYASVTKTVDTSDISVGDPVLFTISIENFTGSSLAVTSISDMLPPNFRFDASYAETGTLSGAIVTRPANLAENTITWTFDGTAVLASGATGTLTFRTDTWNTVEGTYTNVASATTVEQGILTSDPVDVSVGAPYLTISKSADPSLVSPGDTVDYTITYSNDSPANVTNVVITDELPVGLTFVSADNGGTYDSDTHTITWNLGNLASLEGPYTVTYQVTVNADASAQPQNYACINSTETTEACTSKVVTVNTPLKLQKTASQIIVDPTVPDQVTFTINYQNTGSTDLTSVEITDPVLPGFTFVTSTPGTNCPAGVYNAVSDRVEWTVAQANAPPDGTGTVPAGTSGSCNFTLEVNDPYDGDDNPATNTATITATDTPSVSASADVGIVQGACTSPVTYHMHSTTINVGSHGIQKQANTTAPTSATDTIINSPQGAATPVEFARFYQNPPLTSGGILADPVTVTYWAKKTQGNPTVWVELFDYNPDTGATTSLGSGSASAGGTLKQYTINFTPNSTVLYEGHRLLWIFSVEGNGATIDFHYDSTTHDANSDICLEPTTVVMNKVVDKITAGGGETLTYTIYFGNTSTINVTGAQITDTLPDGIVSLDTAYLNGSGPLVNDGTGCPIDPGADYCCDGLVCTFHVNTSDTGSQGQLTSGQTGYLTINVTIEGPPIIFDHTPLTNVAELDTTQTEPISDTAVTYASGDAILGIKKRANDTLLPPGSTTTFYIDIVNIGDTNQASYTVTDYVTGRAYMDFDSDISDGGTLTGPGGTCDPGETCTITWNLTNLGPNQTKTVSYVLQVSSLIGPPSGVPNGFTTETDYAEVDDGTITTTSNIVTVTLYTNANLNITKTADPTDPSPGDTVEYTLTVTNVGATAATDVQVTDPIPTYTSYDAGTLVYQGSSQTDIDDYPGTDNSHFDAVNNRVVYKIGTLTSGTTRTMSFSVIVDSTFPDGTTTITNTATASASNTASKQATATVDVDAAPDLSITKSAPSIVPYPLTTVNGNHVNQTVINVYNVQYIYVGDVIYLDGEVRTVTAVNPSANQITVDSQVSVGNNRPVEPTIKYRLVYSNNGNADATNVTISDTLSSSPQLNYITASPAPTSDPGVDANGTVTWDIGIVAAGETGSILLWTRPTAAGTYLNSATLSSDELPDETSNTTTTIVGGVELTKSASPQIVTNTASGTSTTYTITLTNRLSIAATNITVTDTLPAGFTYNQTIGTTYGGTSGTTCTTPPTPPLSQPIWSGCSINANSTLTITFTADISSGVAAGTYQNPVNAESTTLGINIFPFDELFTTAEDVTVNVLDDLKVTKEIMSLTPGCNPPTTYCEVQYLVTVTNVGTNNNFTAIQIIDQLEPELSYISATPGPTSGSASFDGFDTITWDANIAPASEVLGLPPTNYNYKCIQDHVALSADNQPEVGSEWQDFWEIGGTNGGTWVEGTSYTAQTPGTLTIVAEVTSFSSAILNCASLNTSTPVDTNLANNTGCRDITPTLVVLSDFRAYEESGQVVVEWSTSSEINTVGFYLFRLDESTGDYIKINDQLLPGLLTSPQGGTYSLVDKGASPYNIYTYVLMEIEGKGKENVYGPFTVQVGGGNAIETQSSKQGFNSKGLSDCIATQSCIAKQKTVSSIKKSFNSKGTATFTNRDNGEVRQNYSANQYANYTKKEHVSADKQARIEEFKKQRRATRERQTQQSGTMVKITVTDDGIYYMDASNIASLLDISTTNAVKMIKTNRLSLSTQGKDVAYLPAEGNAGIIFYGEGIDSIYTKENVYWLEEGHGIQIEQPDSEGPDPDNPPIITPNDGTFTETLHFEEDWQIFTSPVMDPESDYWFWDILFISDEGSSTYKTFTIEAAGVADITLPLATVDVHLHGFNDTNAVPDHHVRVSLNDTVLDDCGQDTWNGIEPHTFTCEFDQKKLLHNGVNTFKVEAILDTGAPSSVFYVDSFDLTYQRLYEAVENSLVCRGGSNQTIAVNGFTDPNILVFDITDPYMSDLIELTTIDEINGTYSVSFIPSSPNTPYLAFSTGALSTEFTAWADNPSNLSDNKNNADYLIISPEEFKDAAQSLANYRQSQGLETMVVMLKDIMNEFNYGISSPKAIHDFLTFAQQHWSKPPRYVVLAGEGSFDYKDNLGFGENVIPIMISKTPMGLFPSDNLFVDINADHVPDMSIGRIPVLTSDELQDVLNKIMVYEGSTRDQVLLVADNPDSGGDFPADSDKMGTLVPPQYMLTKIYLSEYDIIDARQLLINAINNGAFLMNYIGHSGYDRLAHEGLLRLSDLGALTNWKLPVLTGMTCLVGQFALPSYDTLSEALVLKSDGGAVAVWAPTGLSYNFLSKILDEEFFKATFGGSEAVLGDMILKALNGYNDKEGASYVMDIYNLLGDPALKIR